MVYRFILSTVILALSFSSNQLQASSLNFFTSFAEESPGQSGIPLLNPEIYSRGTFQDFRTAESPLCSPGFLPGQGDSLKKIVLYKPAAFSADITPLMTKAPELLLTPSNSAKKGNFSRRVKDVAFEHLNAPYRRGASLQTGRSTDCSGFVRYVYRNFLIDLPHSSAQQAQMGKVASFRMDFAKLKVGDLLFFREANRSINHVGLYVGEGKMIHASAHRRRVIITDLREPYYAQKFVVAKRLLEKPQP